MAEEDNFRRVSAKKEQQDSSKHSSTKGSTKIRLLKQKSRQKAAKGVKKTHSEHIQMFRKEGTHLMRAIELGDGRGGRFPKGYSAPQGRYPRILGLATPSPTVGDRARGPSRTGGSLI